MNWNLALTELWPGFLLILQGPLILVDSIRANILLEYFKLVQPAAGGTVTLGSALPLLKWGVLALLVIVIILFLLIDTIWRFLLADLRAKRFSGLLSDLIMAAMVLIFYYVILAYAIYGFFNIILPLHPGPLIK
jgi:hypothetical protein